MPTHHNLRRVGLQIRSPVLNQVLQVHLASELGVTVLPQLARVGAGVVVVTTSSDVTPVDCQAMVRDGARVLVLLVLVPDELGNFRAAGAEAVLVMGDHGISVAETVRSLLGVKTAPE